MCKREINPTPENVVSEQFPIHTEYVDEFIAHFPATQQPYLCLSLCTEKYPENKDHPPTRLLTVESMREQLIRAKNEDPENFDQRLGNGFILKTDLVKLMLYNQLGGEEVGDQMIALHTEILLALGVRLNTRVLPGIYSGDENLSIILSDGTLNKATICETLKKIIQEYLTDPSSPLTLKYDLLHNQIKEIHPEFDPGLTIEMASIRDSVVAKPKDERSHLRERSLFASMIDCCEGKISQGETIPLYQAIQDTLLSSRTSNERYPNFDPNLLSPKAKALFAQLDSKTPDYNLLKSYLELSMYEPIFPGELEVMKINILESYLEREIEQGNWVTLFRLGDPVVKAANKHSHLLGDYHMIATVRILRNYLRKNNYDPNIIQVRQHFGSFVLTLATPSGDPKNIILQLSRLLNDPEPINRAAMLNDLEWDKFSSPSRALPYPVVTTYTQNESGQLVPLTFKNKEDLKTIWQQIKTQKELHSQNETVALNLASQLLHIHGNQVRPRNAPGEHLTKKKRKERAKSSAGRINQALSQLSAHQLQTRPTRQELLAYHLRPQSFVYYGDHLRNATNSNELFT